MNTPPSPETPAPDVLGLGGALPGPGWAVLDAARDQRFTGELVAEAAVTVRVYFDRGRIYVAERATDPPLGVRLVEAGALNQAQLDYGSLRIGDIDHLGRLFDRVPSVNREGVLVINELMTEECVRWLAIQEVRAVTATPYRHHRSGMHRWGLFDAATGPRRPPLAFPAPPPGSVPVTVTDDHAPEPPDPRAPADQVEPAAAGRRTDAFDDLDDFDELVDWDEPSPITALERAPISATRRTATTSDLWAEHATEGEDPPPNRPPEQFELIWPSGETVDVVEPDDAPVGEPDPNESNGRHPSKSGDDTVDPSPLAVRRAIATIDTGSLDARRRLVGAAGDATSPPGRLVVQREEGVWRAPESSATRSVFDEQPVAPTEPEPPTPPPETSSGGNTGDTDHDGRSNALRRLIDSIRRS